MNEIVRQNILGVKVSAIDMQQALAYIEDVLDSGQSEYICVTPAHSVMDCQDDPELLQVINDSGLTTPDGMSIVWLLKMWGHRHVRRVYGPDLMKAVCNHGLAYGWRHFLYGGKVGVPEKLANRLAMEYHGIIFAGTYSPPFRQLSSVEEKHVIDTINAAKPDIIWVGISSPKQEKWMANFINRLDAAVFVGVGAAFDFLSGTKLQAPRWVQKMGLEWLFRLSNDPRRLWKRYIRYPHFVWLAILQALGLKKYQE